MTLKTSKKKLTASLILFIFAAISFAVLVGILVAFNSIDVDKRAWIMPLCVMVYLVLITVSLLLNISYRKNCVRAGAASTVLYVFQWLLYVPLAIGAVIVFVIALFSGALGGKLKKVTLVDNNGKKYELTQLCEGGTEFQDQYGDTWQTFDGNKYERKPKVTDLEGRECILTRHSAFGNNYTDQFGRWWSTYDGGQTYQLN